MESGITNMFSEMGKEVIQGLNNDSNANSLKYWISFLKELDDKRVNFGEICCEEVNPASICFGCFEYHLDRILLERLRKTLWDKYKEKDE
jgi:hypothetical protein